jgi:MFS family permease
LNLTGEMPNTALVVFYAPYILFEIPSNVLMKRFNPHVWLSGCITAFGIVMLGQAFVTSYGGLIATRFFLGLAEAGIFPGSFYLISFWYKREEAQKRFTIYWSSVILAGAFGGLLATAISQMDGLRGMAAWQWIFCLEGIASILVGIAAFFFVTDFPKEASWLTPEEKAFLTEKTRSDESHVAPVTAKDVLHYLSDLKSHLGAIMYFSESTVLSSRHLHPLLINLLVQPLSSPFMPFPTSPRPSSRHWDIPQWKPNYIPFHLSQRRLPTLLSLLSGLTVSNFVILLSWRRMH